MKVSKEAIVGLITALQIFDDEERNSKEIKRLELTLEPIVERLRGVSGVCYSYIEKENPWPVQPMGGSRQDIPQTWPAMTCH